MTGIQIILLIAAVMGGIFVFVPLLGYNAVCFANPVAWIMADLFLVPAYLKLSKKMKKQFGVA